jgi:hypothetical protein
MIDGKWTAWATGHKAATLLLLLLSPVAARKMKASGKLAVGLEYRNDGFISPEPGYAVYDDKLISIMEGEIDLDVDLTDRIRASMDFEGGLDQLSVRMEKGYVEFALDTGQRFRIGNMKKDFALEEMGSGHDLHTVERSLLHDMLESLLIMDHEPSIHYRRTFHREQRRIAWVSSNVGGNGSRRLFENTTAVLELERATITGALLLVQKFEGHNFGVGALSAEYEADPFYGVVEAVGGKDPNASALLEQLDEQRMVLFAATRMLMAYAIALNREVMRRVELVLGGTVLLPDSNDPKNLELELVPGFNVLFDDSRHVILKNTLNVRWSNLRPDRAFSQKLLRASLQLQTHW